MTARTIDKSGTLNDESEPRRAIAIASSMGGIKALCKVVSSLPGDLPAAILVVQHLSPLYESQLPSILSRRTTLRVKAAEDNLKLYAGTIYVAPPNYHLIVNPGGTISLSNAPKQHFVRPSAEYTFKSLASSYREKAIAIVLTGCDGDGKEGVQAVKKMGGKVIAQDRSTSQVFSMPENAIETGCVDLVLPLDEIADGIANMVLH